MRRLEIVDVVESGHKLPTLVALPPLVRYDVVRRHRSTVPADAARVGVRQHGPTVSAVAGMASARSTRPFPDDVRLWFGKLGRREAGGPTCCSYHPLLVIRRASARRTERAAQRGPPWQGRGLQRAAASGIYDRARRERAWLVSAGIAAGQSVSAWLNSTRKCHGIAVTHGKPALRPSQTASQSVRIGRYASRGPSPTVPCATSVDPHPDCDQGSDQGKRRPNA